MIEYMDGGALTGNSAAAAPAVQPLASPSVGWASGPLGAVQAADREIARQTAVRARAVAAFAATRPATTDRQQGERGAMSAERWAARAEVLRPVSEWAAPELSLALSISAPAADALLERSLTLVQRLPRVLDALEDGVLHPGHLWCLLEHVAPIGDERLRARIQDELIDWIAARHRVTTPAALGDRVRRVIAKHNARDAARDLARALRQRGISLRPERAVGMSAVTVVCTTPEAQALYRALGAYADALADAADGGETPRTRGQKMVDCLLDLVLRPGENDLPPVQVLLTVVASIGTLLGGDAPGEVDGQLVPAEMVRRLARAFAGLDPRPTATDAGPAGSDTAAPAGTSAATTSGGAGPDLSAGTTADTATASDGDPDDPEGGPVDRARDQLSADEFDRWLDELTGRAFGDAPASGEAGWPSGHPSEPGWWGPDPRVGLTDVNDLAEATGRDESWASDRPSVGGPLGGDPPTGASPEGVGAPPPDHPAFDGDGAESAGGGGWWAAADRAVEDAGTAVHAARLALGAAERLVRTAQRADAADEAAWQASAAGRVTAAGDALGALAAATDTQREELAALLAATAGGGLAERPRIALVDAVSGALLALTDLPGLRRAGACGRPACRRHPERCGHDLSGRPGLGPPGPTPVYRPDAELDGYGRARDRRCRFPGCRRRVPAGGQLDHHRPWPEGPTSAANLAGYCGTDHRGKHQAPGWRYQLDPDGTLTVTTPTGLTATTTPPPY
ncbi:HNH endonuclease signature motif containing protein [Geodermatophilus sp. TF02-6]|uniref:HNH endonuclease signature motif containing protein n=1 Tax=Geodermatophilus sp. TF02-6 TaxID=2250575 RepID=UPI001314EF1C|nr:HNH endonuclease signature motif containing protein [Geodermatophilus sp. TF02-6]